MTRSTTVSSLRLTGLVAASLLFTLAGCSETPDTEEVAKAKAAAERAEQAANRAEEAVKMIGGSPKSTRQVASNDDSGDAPSSEDSVSPVIINEDGAPPNEVGPAATPADNNRE